MNTCGTWHTAIRKRKRKYGESGGCDVGEGGEGGVVTRYVVPADYNAKTFGKAAAAAPCRPPLKMVRVVWRCPWAEERADKRKHAAENDIFALK